MPWSGGIYSRTNGVYVGTNVWETDKNGGVKIRSDRHDVHDQDLADGINACLTKNGTNAPSANLPMGGYKHTSVANATSRDQYAVAGQIQDSALVWGGSAGGTANALTVSLSPAPVVLATGMMVAFKATATNTGAATLDLNGLGAKSIKKIDAQYSTVESIKAGDIAERQIVICMYDASITSWVLLTVAQTGWSTWTPTFGALGSMTFTSVTTHYAKYRRTGDTVFYSVAATGTTGGSADTRITFTLPIVASNTANLMASCWVTDGGVHIGGFLEPDTTSVMTVRRYDGANWGLGGTRRINVSGFYEVA